MLQFEVCWGLGEVLLSILGRVYLSEIVSKFEPEIARRDNLTHWLISTQLETGTYELRGATLTSPSKSFLLPKGLQ